MASSPSTRFKPATRAQSRLRMAIDGPSGSGKTFTSLEFAFALAASVAPGARVAVIDSENGSASKYANDKRDGYTWDFDVVELRSYSPTEYVAVIEEAGRAGYGALVIDSLSHAWEGKDGALELKDKLAGDSKNSWAGWKDITPMHRRLVDAILTSPCHVIATMRSKTEWVIEKDERGKNVPRKIGLAPVQRSGMEYEFDLYCSMDQSHILTVSKSRCSAVDGLTAVKPSVSFILPVIDWLTTGTVVEAKPVAAPSPRCTDEQVEKIVALICEIDGDIEAQKREILARWHVGDFAELSAKQAEEYLARLAKRRPEGAKGTPPNTPPMKEQPKQEQAAPPTPTPTPEAPGTITPETLACIAPYFARLTAHWALPKEQAAAKWREEWLKPYGGATSAKALTSREGVELVNRLIDEVRRIDENQAKIDENVQQMKGDQPPANGEHKSDERQTLHDALLREQQRADESAKRRAGQQSAPAA